jgi:hypothetical protein
VLATLALAALLAAPARAGAERESPPRNLLTGGVTEAEVARLLLPEEEWHPYPTVADRAAWEGVPAEVRSAFVRVAEASLGRPWGPIPATVILRFTRDGDRSEYDRLNAERRERLATLVMAEVFENRGRFLDEIADGVWAISEQSFWGSTAHLYMQEAGLGLPDVGEPVVDLFAGEAAALLAWTDYLLGERLDSVSPLLRPRIRQEVERRVLTPALERDDFWWMGFGARADVNNWNPWINSNWLAAALLLERDPERRARAVYKVMRSLDRYLNPYPADGGCDEGPGYWDRAAASLFDNLELLRSATAGKVDHYDAPLVRNMARYIYRVYIGGDYFVNTGDAAARLTPDPELVYRFGQRIGDPTMSRFGALLRQRHGAYGPGDGTLGRILPAALAAREIAAAPAAEPLPGEVWLPDLQLMAARQSPGSRKGLYLSAFGGHNGQSHNHNDVGNFVVYGDGRPVLIDVGVETYTAKTFGPHRYEIWTMQSAYHNLPTINGVMQKEGSEYRAGDVSFRGTPSAATFSLDLAPAYPAEAAVGQWRRTLTLDRRAGEVELRERYLLRSLREPVRLSLMTPLAVDVSRQGEVRLSDPSDGRSYLIAYDASRFSATTEEIPLADARLRRVWGERLARVVLTGTGRSLRDEYRITVREAR